MNASDVSLFVTKALPWIGAAASGNIPALVALAAKAVSDATGKPVAATQDAIHDAVASASPDELVKLKQADDELKLKAQALGFQHAEEMRKLDVAEDGLAVDDVKDARAHNAQNAGVFRLAYATLVGFLLVMGFVLYGVYAVLVGGISIKDPGVVAAVAGLVGSIVGYVAANTQTVYNFIFGGSLGSRNSAGGLAVATQQAIKQISSK